MRLVQLTHAMKMDFPFAITGDAGDKLRLSTPAAQFVVNLECGVYADGGEQPGPTRAELEQQEAEIQAGTLKKIGEESSQPAGDSPAEEPKRPYGNAPKSAWIRYACEIDKKMTQERAEGMTKADLMSRYGERL